MMTFCQFMVRKRQGGGRGENPLPEVASNNDVLCLARVLGTTFFSMPESRATKPDGRYFFPLQNCSPPLPS